MKCFTREIRNTARRFATLIATSVVGLTFALVSSVAAAPADKKVIIIKEPEVNVKIVKPEKSDSRGLFGLERGRGNLPFFFNVFDVEDLFEEALEEELEEELEELEKRFERDRD